jgi:hypothetical protein
MTDDTPLPFDLPAVCRKKLTVDFNGGTQSSDGGLLLFREAERTLGVCRRLAAAMPDHRDPDRILHDMFELVMGRSSAIASGYEDAIDFNRLRHDPLMKAAVGRCPETGAPLASQSTISRLENAPSKTDAARLGVALLDQFGTTAKPGRMEILDIDDTFCAAHGGQQLAFWNAHHDERGFASLHIYHVASGGGGGRARRAGRRNPAPGAHPEGHGGEDCHQARDEAPEGALAEHLHRVARRQSLRPRRGDGVDRRERRRLHFGLPATQRLMQWWPRSPTICASIMPKAVSRRCAPIRASLTRRGSWTRPRKVVARLECSLQPDTGETITSTGMRQEVDIRYVVTSLKGPAQYLYEDVYCQRGQMENLIKLHKAQLASDRMSCHSATANQVRLALHTAAYWLMLAVRDAIPQTDPLAKAEFAPSASA